MQNYLTEKTTCKGEVSVFALPNPGFNPEDPESCAWKYELREGNHHWNNKAIRVVTHDVELPVPSGVNLVQKAVATLTAKIAEKRADLAREVAELEEEIAKLSLITYQPDPAGETVVVELGPGYDGEEDVIICD